MREGEGHFNQRYPTVISMIIKELLVGCNGFLRVITGEIDASLHRQCTLVIDRQSRLLIIFRDCIRFGPMHVSAEIPGIRVQ